AAVGYTIQSSRISISVRIIQLTYGATTIRLALLQTLSVCIAQCLIELLPPLHLPFFNSSLPFPSSILVLTPSKNSYPNSFSIFSRLFGSSFRIARSNLVKLSALVSLNLILRHDSRIEARHLAQNFAA